MNLMSVYLSAHRSLSKYSPTLQLFSNMKMQSYKSSFILFRVKQFLYLIEMMFPRLFLKLCLYLCEKGSEFLLIMLVRVPLYSQTENHWNHVDVDAYFQKVKSDSPNRYWMSLKNEKCRELGKLTA